MLRFEAPKRRHSNDRDVDAMILDAGRELFLRNGIRSTSMSAVARKAGVSRPTLYSRYKNIEVLSGDVMRREYLEVFEGIFDDITSAEQFVNIIVRAADELRANDFITSVAQSDPDVLHHFLFNHIVGTHRRLVDYVETLIRAVREQMSQDPKCRIREGDAQVMATFVVMTIQSAVLSAPAVQRVVQDPEQWCAELRRLIRGYLLAPAGGEPAAGAT